MTLEHIMQDLPSRFMPERFEADDPLTVHLFFDGEDGRFPSILGLFWGAYGVTSGSLRRPPTAGRLRRAVARRPPTAACAYGASDCLMFLSHSGQV